MARRRDLVGEAEPQRLLVVGDRLGLAAGAVVRRRALVRLLAGLARS